MSGAMQATTWVGLWWLAPPGAVWPVPRTVFSLSAHMTLIAWCFGGIALAASGWAKRRGAVVAAVGVVAIAAYLVEILEPLARLSPFHYFRGGEILAGTANTPLNLAVLCLFTAAGVVVAYVRFGQRDL
jgi:hypothetical protein